MLDRPTHRTQFDWTPEHVETLTRLWGEGSNAREVAMAMGIPSRSSVLGKVRRLKLPKRAQDIREHAPRRRTNAQILDDAQKRANVPHTTKRHGNKGQPNAAGIRHRAQVAMIYPLRELPVPDGLPALADRIGLMDLGAGDCRWCEGDPKAEHSFCGRPIKDGSSWCPDHHHRVFYRVTNSAKAQSQRTSQ